MTSACTGGGADPAAAPTAEKPSTVGGTAGPPRFEDVTDPAGVATRPTLTWGSNWVDHDGDGDPDLLASRHWHRPRFFENQHGKYVLLEEDFYPYPSFDRHSCAWGEANGDARPDLYCTQGADSGLGSGPNQLLLQTDGGFKDRSSHYGVENRFGRSRTANWLDYDSDGDLDLFVAQKLRVGYPNVMYRNDSGSFKGRDLGLAEELNTLSTTWSDWDSDGDPDLMLLRYRPEPAHAYINQAGRFTRVDLEGVTGAFWYSAVWGDYNGDGSTDLHLVSGRRWVVLRNEGNGSFQTAASGPLEAGRSSAWVDVDNDGDLDVFVVQGALGGVNRPDFFLIQSDSGFDELHHDSYRGPRDGSGESVSVADSDSDGRLDLFTTNGAETVIDDERVFGRWFLLRNVTDAGNSIVLRLVGDATNPWGIGSRIRITAGSLDYRRELNDGIGMRSQSDLGRLVLGIGSESAADVRIDWPDGSSDCINATTGSAATVKKGSSPCD